VLGWRDVPVDNKFVGPTPRAVEPKIRQMFISAGETFFNKRDFDRRLYLVRQRTENEIEFGKHGLSAKAIEQFYICILSANRIISVNFVIAAIFAGASGAFALMAQRHIDPQFAYWTTSGEFVFVAVLAGNQSVAAVFVASMALELVRSFSNLYLPNTWQLVLGVFLLSVILFLPRGIGSLWVRGKRGRIEPAVVTEKEAAS